MKMSAKDCILNFLKSQRLLGTVQIVRVLVSAWWLFLRIKLGKLANLIYFKLYFLWNQHKNSLRFSSKFSFLF